MVARTTKTTKANSAAPKATQAAASVVEPVAAVRPALTKLDDSVLITVKSNVFGELLYINSRTGDKFTWSGCGDVQDLSVGDIRAMKGTQRAFFENQWIILTGVDEPGYEDVSAEEIYKILMLSQYYKNIVDPDNYTAIFSWDLPKMKEAVNSMSSASKMNLVVAANTCIANGTLDSLKKIRALEECLGCELDKP